MGDDDLRVLQCALAQRSSEKGRRTGRTWCESITRSPGARSSDLDSLSSPLAVRASCRAVKLVFLEAKVRATASTRLASDVTSFSTTKVGSRIQLSQCPHGVLSSAEEMSDEERCLSSLSASQHYIFEWTRKPDTCFVNVNFLHSLKSKQNLIIA